MVCYSYKLTHMEIASVIGPGIRTASCLGLTFPIHANEPGTLKVPKTFLKQDFIY